MESWVRSNPDNTASRCGYCCKWFSTWAERLNHIGNHYRYHDYFDRSKWQLNGNDPDGDRDVEAIIQFKDNKNQEDSAMILSRQQQDLKIEIESVFDVRFLQGSSMFFNDWQQDWKSLNILRLRPSSSMVRLGSNKNSNQDGIALLYHLGCPAS